MDHLVYVGIVFLVVGLVMTAFSKTIGIWFCRLGTASWKDAPISSAAQKLRRLLPHDVDYVYNEKDAPRIMRILGVVFMLQGLGFVCFGIWL